MRLIDALAQAMHAESRWKIPWDHLATEWRSDYAGHARAVLAVPAIADALRAAEEEEVYRTALGLACSDGWSDGESAMESYIETAKAHIAAMRAVDDSDIMPGCEFDGPVAL